MLVLKRKIVLLGLIWLSLFLIAAKALQEFDALADVFVWIVAGGGAMVLVGYLEAYLLENIPGWHNRSRLVKVLFPLVIASVLGFGAQAALALDALGGISPAVQGFLLMAINWVFSQRALMGTKNVKFGAGP